MRLENYIMEQDINTASVADIFVEQAQAELDVAMALLDSSIKDMTFQEFYIQEGELGTAVADARTAVRSDGKKHHIKAAFAAIKAFFKFLVTKLGSFFKKNATDGTATVNATKEIVESIKRETGEDVDLLLPYTKEKFGQIVGFYNNIEKNLGAVIDASSAIVDTLIRSQGEAANVSNRKGLSNRPEFKTIQKFIAEAKRISEISKPEPNFMQRVQTLLDSGKMGLTYLDKDDRKKLKNAYKMGLIDVQEDDNGKTLHVMKNEYTHELQGDEWVLVKKNANTAYITHEAYANFVSILISANKVWNERKDEVKNNVDTLDKIASSIVSSRLASMATNDKTNSDDLAAADMTEASRVLSELQTAVTSLIKPAEDIQRTVDKAVRDARIKTQRQRSFELRKKYNRKAPNESDAEYRDRLARQAAENSKYNNSKKYENAYDPVAIKLVKEYSLSGYID